MSIYKIIGSAVLGLVCITLFKRMKDEYAIFLSLLINLGLMTAAIGILSPVINYISSLESIYNLGLITLLYKCTAVAVITSFAADICRDCGESALSSKVELCGKCTVLSLSLPLIKAVFEESSNILTR